MTLKTLSTTLMGTCPEKHAEPRLLRFEQDPDPDYIRVTIIPVNPKNPETGWAMRVLKEELLGAGWVFGEEP